MATTTGTIQLQKLLGKADLILLNKDLYVPSNEFEEFENLVSHGKQAQSVWAGMLTARQSANAEGEPVDNPRTWESVDEATQKLDEEISRINKLRFAKELDSLLVCFTCTIKRDFRPADFPEDLVDCLREVVQALDPHQNLNRLVHALHKTLRNDDKCEPLERLLKEIEAELVDRQQGRIGCGGKKGISLMHRAAFEGMEGLLRALMGMTGRLSNVNVQDSDGQTPLHYTAIAGQTNAMRTLLKSDKLQATREDFRHRTALQIAVEMKRKPEEKMLMDQAAVQQYVDRLAADRQVYVDAANAILVGASLIASVTFGSWLSPPLGYVPYYNRPLRNPSAPSDTYESYAAVDTYISIRIFWVLNSLSFFFSLATIIAGAGCALPMPEAFIVKQVNAVRRVVVLASTAMVLSIIFVLGAFAAAGFAALPPQPKYQTQMTITVALGTTFCVAMLLWFMSRLYLLRPNWWRRIENDMLLRHITSRAGREMRIEKQRYFIS